MTITERAAYIKGLAEGLGIDDSTKEGKVINALIGCIDDMALIFVSKMMYFQKVRTVIAFQHHSPEIGFIAVYPASIPEYKFL